MSGVLPQDQQARYLADRASSVVSEAAREAFEAEWGPVLAVSGYDTYGRLLPEPASDDDIRFSERAQPEPDWESFGVLSPAVLPEGVSEVDVLEFIAQGDTEDDEEWLVQGLVPKHGLTILGGNPKTGKTLFALDLCLAVDTGRPFFGRDTATTAFLFVTEEGTPGEMRKRLRRLIGSAGAPTQPGRLIHRRSVRFDDPHSWQQVRDALGRLAQPTLLVLDPLRDLLVGDENDSATIATVARSIHAILRDYAEVTVVLLHHLSKRGDGEGGQRLRGSSALWGTADCTLILKADPIPDDVAEGGEVELRGSVSVEPRNAQRGRFWWRWDAKSGFFLESGAEARTLADKAAAHIAEHGPTTAAELAEALGTTGDVMRHSLGREHSRFRVIAGAAGQPSVWGLVE